MVPDDESDCNVSLRAGGQSIHKLKAASLFTMEQRETLEQDLGVQTCKAIYQGREDPQCYIAGSESRTHESCL